MSRDRESRPEEELSHLGPVGFLKGFVACLWIRDHEFVVTTLDDRHQAAFHEVMKHLRPLLVAGGPAVSRLPDFYPAHVTGTYEDLDRALHSLERVGIVRHRAPLDDHIEIALTEEWATGMLEVFTEAEREVLSEAAKIFYDFQRSEGQTEDLA